MNNDDPPRKPVGGPHPEPLRLQSLTPQALESVSDEACFARIEALRAELLGSDAWIEYVDHGAVAPDAGLTRKEMYRGRRSRIAVRRVAAVGREARYLRYLFALVRVLQPARVVELGTCCGFSAMYLAAGYAGTQVHTLEASPDLAALATRNFQRLGVRNAQVHVGRFEDLLEPLLDEQAPGLVFVDGQHSRDATLAYFRQLRGRLARPGIIVFDDIRWSDGMRSAWQRISATPGLGSLDLQSFGLVLLPPDG